MPRLVGIVALLAVVTTACSSSGHLPLTRAAGADSVAQPDVTTQIQSAATATTLGPLDQHLVPDVLVRLPAPLQPSQTQQLAGLVPPGRAVTLRTGKLKMRMFPDSRYNFVFVDDVADGIVLAYDKGHIGEAYLLGGEVASMDDLYSKAAAAMDKKPPRMAMPVGLAKASAPLGPIVGPMMGFPPNMRELVKTSDVTITFKDDKARRELGYDGRPLEAGLRETVTA